jgi:hypothetical protein
MVRLVAVLAVLLVTPALGEAQRLEGVWLGTEVEIVNGPNAGVTPVQPRLLIYTESHFMWAFVNSTEPRDLLPPVNETSDSQLAAAAGSYQSSAGTYLRDGNSIIYNRRVDLIPNNMQPENQPLVREIRTLTRGLLETQATNADGITTILRYRRVE